MNQPLPLVVVSGARMRFGVVTALDGVSITLGAGECIGLVGHNGAGKSTLVNVLNGGLTPQQGTVSVHGGDGRWGVAEARAQGLRCVFQELSLCPNLTIVENTRLMHKGHFGMPGAPWRGQAARIIRESLDRIFPGHGIDPQSQVSALPIAQRQMVEIAMAFADPGTAPRIVILDEPTSSLDGETAAQLLAHVRSFVTEGGCVVLISHILSEILSSCDRIVVMKDGQVVADRPAHDFTQDSLVTTMGSTARHRSAAARERAAQGEPLMVHPAARGLPFSVRPGEVVGLSGLAGHGQTELLHELYARASSRWKAIRDPKATFVAGDRRLDGVFELWSIRMNLVMAALSDFVRRGLVDTDREWQAAEDWKKRIGIRTPDLSLPILSLSGGNQQKVLFARALLTRSPLVLMDDPMRGVDVGTKQEVYDIIRAEADKGRAFVWYSTELEEMEQCDRVFVFREGVIEAELTGAQITEEAMLAASFRGAAA